MSLQDFMNSRRTFLQRSALGAGSVLFAPLLLESCTDHIIPDPVATNPPVKPPLVGDDDSYSDNFDANDDAKIIITQTIEMIPFAGDLLGGLVEIFWPDTQVSVWDQIKDRMEQLINQKLDAGKYQDVSEDLGGLTPLPYGLFGNLNQYRSALKENADILSQWRTAKGDFIHDLGHFQANGYELLLLPLFAQFANLHLSILRDGAAFGTSWGMNDAETQQTVSDLTNYITQYKEYAYDWFAKGHSDLLQATKSDSNLLEPFYTVNKYTRQMTLAVLDFADSWPYFDITQFPFGANVVLGREIYSDPYGSLDTDRGLSRDIISSPPTQLPTNVTVWGGSRLDAFQLTYPAGSGPRGVTQTVRFGDQPDNKGGGGSNQPPNGGSFNLTPANPITQVQVQTSEFANNNYAAGPFVGTLQFKFADGSETNLMGGTGGTINGVFDSGYISYTNEALSSITKFGPGVAEIFGTLDNIVFGFQLWQSPEATLRAIRSIYVTSPKERSAADFAKEFPKLVIPADLITDEVKTARQKHWERVKERAKK